jgi:16S rRNA (guanine527-N7)-methyltransferase
MILPKQIVDPGDLITQGSRILGVPLEDSAVYRMLRHMELLRVWGAKVNLTALKQPWEIAALHFLDSLTVFKVIPNLKGLRILDIGTGAGFPGIVLRTARDTLQLTLLDRDAKKIVFLKHLARELGLKDTTYINRDLKDLVENSGSTQFDIAVSRAFSSNPAVMDSTHSLLAPDGGVVVMGGPSFKPKDFLLSHFRESMSWEGLLPFSNRLRKVCLYSKRS